MEIYGPTLTYAIFGGYTIAYMYMKKRKIRSILINTGFHLTWLALVHFTCYMGYKGLGWVLVFVPLVAVILLLCYIARIIFNTFKTRMGQVKNVVTPQTRAKKVVSKIDEYFKGSKR